MKIINQNILLFVSIVVLIIHQNSFSQVSTYQSIQKIGRKQFNCINNDCLKYRYNKNKSIKVVFSDKENNTTYKDPYGQQKAKPQGFLKPYFVIKSKNGFHELVEADSSLIGKPKGFFSVLFSKKNHFTDTKSLKYVGWLPSNSLINYSTSIIDPTSNKVQKYKVGFRRNSLFSLHQYFNKDSLNIYKDPFLKIKSKNKLLINQVVYPYKYNITQKSVFVSTKPILKDTINQFSGWIPSDLIFPIGENKVFKINKSFSLRNINKNKDTIFIKHKDIYSKYLYDISLKSNKNKKASHFVSTPIYVWNHRDNKLINVDGDDVFVSEVSSFKKESKVVNFHFIFDEKERKKIKLLINSLQTVWVSLSKQTDIKLSFSAICTGKRSFVLPKTKSFAKWLDFIQQVSEDKRKLDAGKKLNIKEAISETLYHKDHKNKSFENNFFIIVKNRHSVNLYNDTILMKKMAVKSSKLLFVQLNNAIGGGYQKYLLNAKESIATLGEYYNSFIRRYTVDNSLIVENNSLKNIHSDKDNIYIYDAPMNSRFNGGLIFPKINELLSPSSLTTAIDSILVNTQKTNKNLIDSFDNYKNELSILRSKPTYVLRHLFKNDRLSDSLRLSQIDRNNIEEVFYDNFEINKNITDYLGLGYILNKEELLSLLENYRMLLPYFSNVISKKERKLLKKMYKKQIKGINKSFGRSMLSKRSTIGDLYYFKTGFYLEESSANNICIKKLKRNIVEEKCGFSETYIRLTNKLNLLEKKFLDNQLEKTKDNRYYIPKEMLL